MSSSVINKSPTKASGSAPPDERTQSMLCTEKLTMEKDAKSKISDVTTGNLENGIDAGEGLKSVKETDGKIADKKDGRAMVSEKSHDVPQEGPSLKSEVGRDIEGDGNSAGTALEKVAPLLDCDLARGMDEARQDGKEGNMKQIPSALNTDIIFGSAGGTESRKRSREDDKNHGDEFGVKRSRQGPPAMDHINEESDSQPEVIHCACHKFHPESSHAGVSVSHIHSDSPPQDLQIQSTISLQDLDAAKALLQPTESTDGREETSDHLLSLEGALTWIDPASSQRLELIEEAAPRLRSLALSISNEFLSALTVTSGERLLQLEEFHLDNVFTDSTPAPDEAELFSCFKMEHLTVLSIHNFSLSSIHPLLSSTVRNLCVSGDPKTFSNVEILGMLSSIPHLRCLRFEGYIRADDHEVGPEDQVVLGDLEELYLTMTAVHKNTIRWITAVDAPALRWVELVIPQPWSKCYGENRTGMVLDVMKPIVLQVTDNNIAKVAWFDALSDYHLQLQLMNGCPSTRIQGNRFGHRLSSVEELQITGKAYASKALDEWSDMFNLMTGVQRLLLHGQAVKAMPYGISRGSVHDHDTYFPHLESIVLESIPFSWAPHSSRETFKMSLLSSLEDHSEAMKLNELTISESDGIGREDIEVFGDVVNKVIWIQDGEGKELDGKKVIKEGVHNTAVPSMTYGCSRVKGPMITALWVIDVDESNLASAI
ncbi:hypothetical protein OE88DRAFT_1648932 [Heliocybe sulcata]|uniref:RNI-like protein n=1 Tax=Heliocybe sulcata TaxID=5364 RepID=A0A5C3MMF4_9AGAM|nr:hypothetical protein OE88DRAFT_1648932 [Heliocybe sulcata]